MMAGQISLLVCLLVVISSAEEESCPSTFKVASVEYYPIVKEGAKPIEILRENANRYSHYAYQASLKNADIIVFPEVGLTSIEGLYSTRDELILFTQNVPDPQKDSWNPCLNPDAYNNTEILHLLSCASRDNSIALLANLFSLEDCNNQTDSHCPPDGHFIYNTNVVFDKNGTLILRYHKKHLFFEPLLNSPSETQYGIFTINGIRFGTFVCFDIYYEDPAIKLVKEKGIRNIIFSTAWGNQMPFLTGLQVFSRWARGLQVNLIVSNYHKPQYGRLGTGIYSSQQGSVAETFDISKNGVMLIADLSVNPSKIPLDHSECLIINTTTKPDTLNQQPSYIQYEMVDKPSTKPVAPIHKIFYQTIANFSALLLQETEHSASLCHNDACCKLDYKMTRNEDKAIYALIAYDGVHVMDYFLTGMKTCAIMRCDNSNDIESCARMSKTNATTTFDSVSLIAILDSNIVFPSVINTDLQLVKNWNFTRKICYQNWEWKIEVQNAVKLQSISIYQRVYSRDKVTNNLQ